MIKTQCDTRGRIYLRGSIRERLGKAFIVLEVAGGVLLLSVPADPVADLALVGEKLQDHDLAAIKRRIAEKATREATA